MSDLINGSFELLGSFFILISILKLRKDKAVAGISWLHMTYFTLWGFWNLYYYPNLNQWISFVGGVGIAATNSVYVAMLFYYRRRK